ncbi:alpha,alpha-trehalase nth1 [Tritrichomonas musculus]|uniref:Alpha,alpha-trehalase nth1 n=1 Tax=Tritrichomonas musculus TaxID=1915356 RepID=A0ABR2KKV2_9EUKA
MKKTKLTPLEQLNILKSFREKEFKENRNSDDKKEIQKSNEKALNPDKKQRFQVLISLMLSAQTKDSISEQALKNLDEGLEGGLTASSLSTANVSTVKELIKRVSFSNKKSENIIEAAKLCQKDYNGDIPDNYDDLISIKGVGKKMATLTMSEAWNKRVGIGVDTHIHRTANRLKWVKTKTPEQTEDDLQNIFPEELWEEVDKSVLYFGQTICNAVSPKCDRCPIYDSCTAKKTKNKRGNQKKQATNDLEDIEEISSNENEDLEDVDSNEITEKQESKDDEFVNYMSSRTRSSSRKSKK